MQGKVNSHKENKIRVFGSTMENVFWCLVTFYKCYFLTNFSHFLKLFSQHPNKFYNRKFQNIHLTQPKIIFQTIFHCRTKHPDFIFLTEIAFILHLEFDYIEPNATSNYRLFLLFSISLLQFYHFLFN